MGINDEMEYRFVNEWIMDLVEYAIKCRVGVCNYGVYICLTDSTGMQIGGHHYVYKDVCIDTKQDVDKLIKALLRFEKKIYVPMLGVHELKNKLYDELDVQTEHGMIYAIHVSGMTKIGRTTNWGSRKKAFQTHLPFKLDSFCVWKLSSGSDVGAEGELHRMFHSERKNGEWFDLTAEDLVEVDKYLRMEDGATLYKYGKNTEFFSSIVDSENRHKKG